MAGAVVDARGRPTPRADWPMITAEGGSFSSWAGQFWSTFPPEPRRPTSIGTEMFTLTKVTAVTQRSDRSISLWCLCITADYRWVRRLHA
jgi:hypothetical protein